MKELQNLLAKLGEFYIDPKKESHLKHIYFEDGLNVYYSIETNLVPFDNCPTFRAILVICHNESSFSTWGCTTEEENKVLLRWFIEQDTKYHTARYILEKHIQEQYKNKLGI